MEKLIIEYFKKIDLCRNHIDSINKALTNVSKLDDDDRIADLLNDLKIIETQRRCYLQFIKDLEKT